MGSVSVACLACQTKPRHSPEGEGHQSIYYLNAWKKIVALCCA